MTKDPRGVRAEAIRALRTHIIAQHLDFGRRALVLCAPHVEAGCSFVAVNLAVSLAQIGLSTLLIDADMRGSGVEPFFPHRTRSTGLRGALSSTPEMSLEAIERDSIANLSILRSGGVAPNPLELLGDNRFPTLITSCLQDFDITIIDTPPANAGADAVRISTVIGYSLIVAREKQSRIADVELLSRELVSDGVKVVGNVLYSG